MIRTLDLSSGAVSGPPARRKVVTRTFRVFTDGGCLNNGKRDKKHPRKAGIGIYFPDGELEDIGVPYYGYRLDLTTFYAQWDNRGRAVQRPVQQNLITNQRAELEAIYVALESISELDEYQRGRDTLAIYTDSMYSLDCLTKWAYAWEKNGWKARSGKPVKNQDIIRPLFTEIKRHRVLFHHTPSHTEGTDERSRGNAQADMLATHGIQGWKE